MKKLGKGHEIGTIINYNHLFEGIKEICTSTQKGYILHY